MTKLKTYNELLRYHTFEERYQYLKLGGVVGESTFGFERWINQRFYHSDEWKQVRNLVVVRDNGCDLGIPGYEIYRGLMVHHMNPLILDDIKHGDSALINPNFLITVSLRTHNAIHFGNENMLPREPITRRHGDTKLW